MHMHPLRLSLFALLLLTVLGLSQEAKAEEIYITIEEDGFVPSRVNATIGDEIFWYNNDTRTHKIEEVNGHFENEEIEPGQTQSIVIDSYFSYNSPGLGKETITFNGNKTVNFSFTPSHESYLYHIEGVGYPEIAEFGCAYYPSYPRGRIAKLPEYNDTLKFRWVIDEFPALETNEWINEWNDPVFSVEVTFASSGNKTFNLHYNNSYIEGYYNKLKSYFYDGGKGFVDVPNDNINATIFVEDIPKLDFSLVPDFNNLEIMAGEKIYLNISLEDNTVWPAFHAEQDTGIWHVFPSSSHVESKQSTPENPKFCWSGSDLQNMPSEATFRVSTHMFNGESNNQHKETRFGGEFINSDFDYGNSSQFIYETTRECSTPPEKYYIEITFTLRPESSYVWNTIWEGDEYNKIYYTDTFTTTINITVNPLEMTKDKDEGGEDNVNVTDAGEDEEGIPGFGIIGAVVSIGLIARLRRR